MSRFAKYHPARWGVRAHVTILTALGLIGLTGCAPDKPDSLSDACAEAVMHRMLDGRDDDITDADINRYFDEECEVVK